MGDTVDSHKFGVWDYNPWFHLLELHINLLFRKVLTNNSTVHESTNLLITLLFRKLYGASSFGKHFFAMSYMVHFVQSHKKGTTV